MSSFDFSRVLTTGGSGMIGSYVDFGLRPDMHELDILDEVAVMQYVQKEQPSAIIHLAGATDMARCESELAYAYELNVRGTHTIARAARAVGATLVYASTSRVFRGDQHDPYTENDLPDPTTQYGMTKYLGELIAATVEDHIIARTVWVFGGGPEKDNKFYGKMIQQLRSNTSDIVALDDVVGSPTFGKDFVATIKELLAKGERGIFHIANAGTATRYDIARALAEQDKSTATIRAVDRSHFATGATLPSNEAVVSKRVNLRPWNEALSEYINDEWAPPRSSATITA